MCVDVLVRPWEKLVMGMKVTEVRLLSLLSLMRLQSLISPLFVLLQLGALRFDRDLRSISAFLSSQTSFGGSREKFIRLQQMSTILNLGAVRLSRPFLPVFA